MPSERLPLEYRHISTYRSRSARTSRPWRISLRTFGLSGKFTASCRCSSPAGTSRRRFAVLVRAEPGRACRVCRLAQPVLARSAEVIGAAVLDELSVEPAGEGQIEMMAADTRAPPLGFVIPSALDRVVLVVVSAYDKSLDPNRWDLGE